MKATFKKLIENITGFFFKEDKDLKRAIREMVDEGVRAQALGVGEASVVMTLLGLIEVLIEKGIISKEDVCERIIK